MMSLKDYGKDTIAAAIAASGLAAIAAITSQKYVAVNSDGDAQPWPKAFVKTHPVSGPTLLFIRWNADTCAPTASGYDEILEPGDLVASPDGVLLESVAIYSSDAVTYGTDVVVKGWV